MKVALVIGRYDAHGGGAERWTDRHARFLLARGIEVHLVASAFRDPPTNARCHEVRRVRTTGGRLAFADRAEQLCLREGFDIVHDMGDGWHSDFFMPHHGARIAGLEHNLEMLSPLARRIQDIAHRWMPRYHEFAELERRQYSLDRPTLFLAVSRMVQRHMQRYFGVPSDRIRLVYNGVDTARFQPADVNPVSRQSNAIRQQWGWSDRVVYLLAAHNFQLKGLDSLIRAMALLHQDLKGSRRSSPTTPSLSPPNSVESRVGLVVMGGGRRWPYQALARRLGCADSIRFVGNQSDPLPYYQAADVYVQPTYYDPCSLVVLEALACGLPVVTTRQNGAGELIRDGREGYVLSGPRDVPSLAEAMRAYLDPDHRRASSRAARRLAEQHTLERNSMAILDLYRDRTGTTSAVSRRTA